MAETLTARKVFDVGSTHAMAGNKRADVSLAAFGICNGHMLVP